MLDYLGRYTHRVAIATVAWSSSVTGRFGSVGEISTTGQAQVMTLDADEFIRRFLQHVLPGGFRRIRHFGFLANTHRTARLATIRALLDVPAPTVDPLPNDYRARYALLTGRSLDICPCCGGVLVEVTTFARPRASSPIWCDSS